MTRLSQTIAREFLAYHPAALASLTAFAAFSTSEIARGTLAAYLLVAVLLAPRYWRPIVFGVVLIWAVAEMLLLLTGGMRISSVPAAVNSSIAVGLLATIATTVKKKADQTLFLAVICVGSSLGLVQILSPALRQLSSWPTDVLFSYDFLKLVLFRPIGASPPGAYLTMSVAVGAFGFALWRRSGRHAFHRWVAVLTLSVSYLTAALSLSRSIWLASAFLLFAQSSMARNLVTLVGATRRTLVTGCALAGVVLLLLAGSMVRPEVRGLISPSMAAERSVEGRVRLVKEAGQLLLERPLLGSGRESFARRSIGDSGADEIYPTNPFNGVARSLVERGMVGTVLGLCALVAIAIMSARKPWVFLSFGCAVLALIVRDTAYSAIGTCPGSTLFFGSFLGLCCANFSATKSRFAMLAGHAGKAVAALTISYSLLFVVLREKAVFHIQQGAAQFMNGEWVAALSSFKKAETWGLNNALVPGYSAAAMARLAKGKDLYIDSAVRELTRQAHALDPSDETWRRNLWVVEGPSQVALPVLRDPLTFWYLGAEVGSQAPTLVPERVARSILRVPRLLDSPWFCRLDMTTRQSVVEALAALAKEDDVAQPHRSQARRATLTLLLGQPDEARKDLSAAIASSPFSARLRLMRWALAVNVDGRADDSDLRLANILNPYDADIAYFSAAADLRRGEVPSSLRTLVGLVKSPEDLFVHYRMRDLLGFYGLPVYIDANLPIGVLDQLSPLSARWNACRSLRKLARDGAFADYRIVERECSDMERLVSSCSASLPKILEDRRVPE